jgi:hypothetical protein
MFYKNVTQEAMLSRLKLLVGQIVKKRVKEGGLIISRWHADL